MSTSKLPIQAWAEEDRPREKLLQKGKSALSNAELLAILIGSGNDELSAVDLCKNILHAVQNDLHLLSKSSPADLMKHKGIGVAKALTIVAAMELGRRTRDQKSKSLEMVQCSADIYLHMKPFLQDLSNEEFWVIYLNRSNKIIKSSRISIGGISGTVVDSRIIYKTALELLASYVVLVHNHPSGNTKPSETDIRITKNMKEAGKFLDIQVLDHIIFTNDKYFSFADEGLL